MGLSQVPSWLHAYATALLAQRGFIEPERPDIISGYRSRSEQLELWQKWESGRRAGIKAKPAERSWHMAGLAWDVETGVNGFTEYADFVIALARASQIPLRDGRDFGDTGHFAVPMGEQPPSIHGGSIQDIL